jgi:alpha-galactosidase
MGLELHSRFLQFQAHLERGEFDVFSTRDGQLPALQGVQGGLQAYIGNHLHQRPWRWERAHIIPERRIEIDAGAIHQLQIVESPDERGIACTATFALVENAPLLLWKISLENGGSQGVEVKRVEMLQLHPGRGQVNLAGDPAELAFFANGWQSWAYSGVYRRDDRRKATRLGPLRQPTRLYDANPPLRRGRFSSDMFGVLADLRSRQGMLLGFLSQQQAFGSFEVDIREAQPPTPNHARPWLCLWANGDRAWLAPGASMETDWACLQFLDIDDPDPLGAYLQAAARQNQVALPAELSVPTGWCSWYQFSSSDYVGTVTPDDLRRNLSALAGLRDEIPLQVFQIDDGFQSCSGDWLTFSEPFVQGVAGLAAEIRASGFDPGLWLAPFIVHPSSHLAAGHPDWLLRTRQGRPVNAGFFWNAFTTALDLTHPGALAYAAEVVRTAVHEWGFGYLKLDFLFAAAVPGRYRDPSLTRAQVLRRGLEAIRQAAGPEAFLLGCGCPLGPAIGIVDAMRINADTASRWRPAVWNIEGIFAPEPDLPAARNALHNALTRAPMHRRWWINDPDCLQLRAQTRLSLAELQTACSVVALSGGSLLVSDEIAALDAERLRILASLLPPVGLRPEIVDWFDSTTPAAVRLDLDGAVGRWHLLARFNWTDRQQPAEINLAGYGLPEGRAYWGRDFWCQSTELSEAGCFQLGDISPHGVRLLAVRPYTPGEPAYLGSDLHISQGLEVIAWKAAHGELSFSLRRPGEVQGKIELYLPGKLRQAACSHERISAELTPQGTVVLPVQFDSSAKIQVEWEA